MVLGEGMSRWDDKKMAVYGRLMSCLPWFILICFGWICMGYLIESTHTDLSQFSELLPRHLP